MNLTSAPTALSSPSQAGTAPLELEETRAALLALGKGRFGKLPATAFVELLIATTQDADWPVRRAAMEALIRRFRFAKRDGVQVLSRPKAILGRYAVGASAARASGERAGKAHDERKQHRYQTELIGRHPLVLSCNCADFVRSSLGLCKHGFAVLQELGPKALSETAKPRTSQSSKPRLSWDPTHPLHGSADRLLRLRVDGARGTQFERGKPATDQDAATVRLRWITRQLRAAEGGAYRTDAAALRVLKEEAQRAERLAANERGLKRAWGTLAELQRKLYDYQKAGVRRFLETGRLLLADDMGLGKTTQAIACCHALFRTRRIQRGLVVVPAALKPQWQREWEQTTRVPLIDVDGSPAQRRDTYRSTESGFLLVGYEQLLRDVAEVRAYAPEFVLLDEAQRIKNWATKSAATVKSLDAEYRLVLTGTPMENRFEELASLMDFVDDTALEPKWRLVPLHTLTEGNAGRGVAGARNLETLRGRLGNAFLRRRRAEVLSQLPPRTDTRMSMPLTDQQAGEHAELRQPIAALMRRAAHRPLTQVEFLKLMQLLTRQRMICNGLALTNFDEEWPRCAAKSRPTERFFDSLFSPKLIGFRGLVEQFVLAQDRKVVVFSQWRRMLRLADWSVRDVLADAGRRSLFFTGAESRKQREKAIVEFHDDPSASVLFLSDAGGVGLNLQRAASCCINLELPWNPAVLEQRIGRIYRLGQTRPIEVVNLVAEEGIESRIAALVANKQAVFSTLFDGTSDEVLFDGKSSFLEGVKKLVEPTAVPSFGESESDADDEFQDLVGEEEPAAASGVRSANETQAEGAQSASDEHSRPANPLAQALAGLSVQRTAQGGLRIEAPPQLAGPLADLFESLALSLRDAAE
jgi:hypothetical protein